MDRNLNMAGTLAAAAEAEGGRVYYVGGFVRDRLLGLESKDIDLEVHGLPPEQLEAILGALGTPLTMGESYQIYSLSGYDLDISLPRVNGVVSPFAGTREAARRRDFTCNALMEDVLTGEILDAFGGQEDLKQGILRHVDDETFRQDPLRVLRCAQFAARFGFTVAPETVELCKHLSLEDAAHERVLGELQKAMLKSPRPSRFFEVLREMNQLSRWFPEVEALIGVPQPPRHHAEGDVWNHTMRVVDAAAELKAYADNPFGLMLSALTHDFGKIVATTNRDGVIHAYGHEIKGLPLVRRFLARLTDEKALMQYVENQTKLHMKPNRMAADGSSVKSTNKLFDDAVDPEGLICLAFSDNRGSLSEGPFVSHEEFFRERLRLFRETMAQPYVRGRDLIEAGIQPDRRFGEYLAFAHKLRLSGVPKENALKQTLAQFRNKSETK